MPNELVSTQRSKSTTMILGIVLTAVTFLSGRLVTPLALHFGLDDMMVRTATRAVVGVICLVVMGGASMLRPNLEKIRSAWFFARPLVIINIIIATLFGTWAVFLLLFFGELNASQLGNMFYVTILCILVGINEEAMFRGLMFGGLLAGLGERKGGPVLAAVISSLAFGFAHVVFDISFDNAWGLLQGALKTIESGMFGLILCVSVLEERDLVGPITVHAFFDWILMIGNASAGSLPTANYVSTEQNVAIAGSVIFAVFIVLYLPKTIQSFRRLSAAPLPQYGPFVPAEESAKLTNTAWSDAHASNPEHMASREDRLRNHKVLDHKVLTIFATITVFMIVANLVAIVPMIVFGQGTASKVAVAVCNIALSLLMLFGYQDLFHGHAAGSACCHLCAGQHRELAGRHLQQPADRLDTVYGPRLLGRDRLSRHSRSQLDAHWQRATRHLLLRHCNGCRVWPHSRHEPPCRRRALVDAVPGVLCLLPGLPVCRSVPAHRQHLAVRHPAHLHRLHKLPHQGHEQRWHTLD